MKEKQAVLLLLGLAVIGHGARLLLQHPSDPPGAILVETPSDSDPATHRARALRVSRPLGPGETVDLNLAGSDEISRLPGIGMSLAKRIVEYRTAHGLFRGPGDLDRVPGVGSALLNHLQGRVRFGGVNGPSPASPDEAASRRITVSYGTPGPSASGPVNLNSATEAELLGLPGIGPARARAILAYRRDKGPFAVVSDLQAVPGISQALVKRLAPLLTVQ